MLENQFIQFSTVIDPQETSIAVPTKNRVETRIYTEEENVELVTQDGSRVILTNAANTYGKVIAFDDLTKIAPNECYRLKLAENQYEPETVQHGANEVNVPRSEWQLGSTYIGDITQGIRLEAGDYKIKIEDLYPRRWKSNGTPENYEVIVILKINGEEYTRKYHKGYNDIDFLISIDKTSSIDIEVRCSITIPAENDKAFTISFSQITSSKINKILKYSNILRRVEDEEQYAVVKYSCKEPAFGFPFDGTGYVQQLMPINLYSPQFKQEDKIYTKRNGEQVVLFANMTKEYDGETDYIPMEWHEKILMALSCDEVYINGERVTKSGNYEIDHDNCTYTDCGIKLLRATFKVTTNVTQRNSNY